MLNRRQFLGAAGATFLGLGLAACGSEGGDATTGSADAKKVAIFLDGPINDGGWGASCYKAMTDAAK